MMRCSSSQQLGRNDARYALADHLFGRVAEHALGAGVPGAHDSVERLADDGVVGAFDDRRQGRRLDFLRVLLGHVDDMMQRACGGARDVAQRRGADHHKPAGAVGALEEGRKFLRPLAVGPRLRQNSSVSEIRRPSGP